MGQRVGLDMTAVSLSVGVDWVCGSTDWADLQQPIILLRAKVGIEGAGLGLDSRRTM